MSKKPIGYSKKDRDEMRTLIERTEPNSGDYVGSGTVTEVPKKKKMKRMQMGGMAMPTRDAMRDEKMKKRVVKKYDRMSSRFPGYKPDLASPVDTREELQTYRQGLRDYRKANPGVKPARPMRPVVPVIPSNQPAMKGGGLARKGVGMAMAKGGLVKANGCAARGKTKGRMM